MGWDPQYNRQGLGSGDYTMGPPGSRERWEFKSVSSPNPASIARAAKKADRQAYRAKLDGAQPVTRLVLDATPGGHSTAATRQGFDEYIQSQVGKGRETRINEAHLWGLDEHQQAELTEVSPNQVQERVSELKQDQTTQRATKADPVHSTPGDPSPSVPGTPEPGYDFSRGTAGPDTPRKSPDSTAQADYEFKPAPKIPDIGRGSR